MKCLVVENSPTVRRAILRAVQSLGDVVAVVADHPHEVMTSLDQPLELAIVEWAAEDSSAIDLVRAMRANPNQADARILLVSTRSAAEDVRLAIDAGVDDYLLRPFEVAVLLTRLQKLVALPPEGEAEQRKAA